MTRSEAALANWQRPEYRARRSGPRGSYIHWTPDMDAALRDGRAKGLTQTTLGASIGVSTYALRKRAMELGLWPRNQ